MGIHHLPAYSHYWSEDDFLRVDAISRIMSKTRYEKMSQYLHIADDSRNPPRGRPGHDPIAKVRPLWNMANSSFKRRYHPHRELSVDEAMVGFKGRLSFKQYLPMKPTKWGIKIWELADSTNGYVLSMDVYTGKSSQPNQPTRGLGFRVVDTLMSPFYGRNHHLYFDSFYSSVPLAEHLEANGTYTCSTIRQNRLGLPQAIKMANPRTPNETVRRQKGNLLATVWMDKRKVTLLSTCQDPRDGQVLRRRRGQQATNIARPIAITSYNKFMGGVDLSDQLRSYYPVGRDSVKWWRYLMWFLVDLCIINSFIIYSETLPDQEDADQKKKTHLQFRLSVAKALIGGYSSREKAGRKRSGVLADLSISSENIGSHKLVRLPKRKKACVQCSVNKTRTPAGRAVESSFSCSVCSVALCKNGCFTEFHHHHMQ
jgi:hypothetical protein